MKSKGQEIAEFAIISLIVAMAAIGSIFVFSDNLKVFFENNPAVKKANTPVATFDMTQDNTSYTRPEGAEDINITDNEDGSFSFIYSGQNVTFSNDIIANLSEVFTTTGAAGIHDDVIDSIIMLIDAHKDEYAPADVPIQMGFGLGNRNQGESYKPYPADQQIYQGFAEANTVSMAVGDHIMVIQKDQGSIFGVHATPVCTTNSCGSHIIEFNSNSPTGTIIKSEFPPLEGKTLNNVTFLDGLPQGNFSLPGQSGVIDDSSWKMDFSETVQKFITGS